MAVKVKRTSLLLFLFSPYLSQITEGKREREPSLVCITRSRKTDFEGGCASDFPRAPRPTRYSSLWQGERENRARNKTFELHDMS